MNFELSRDILCELNSSLQYSDFDVLSKLDEEYDLLGTTDFELFILEEDLDQIISRMICDWLPYRVMQDKNFEITEVVKYDFDSNRVIALSDHFQGGVYIKEQIEKMNKLLSNGQSKD